MKKARWVAARNRAERKGFRAVSIPDSSPFRTAERYAAMGWSIIPIQPETKEPACRSWKPFQDERPSNAKLKRWFGNGIDNGMAVILGDVSNGLICRDFDDMAAYTRWATDYPQLAETLPTVETGRPGRHVYCRGDVGQIRDRSNSDGGIIHFEDGELRGGGYCLLPPSVHPSGHVYRWLNPLDSELPFVDLFEAGFLPCNTEDTESAENTGGLRTLVGRGERKANGSFKANNSGKIPLPRESEIELAIQRTIPSGPGRRHKMVFRFARELKALAALADAPLSELKPLVRRWYQRALEHISTKAFEETWFDFAEGWGRVKFPAGKGRIDMIFRIATESELPAVAMEYEQEGLRNLVALCRELQRACGKDPFFLATRTAGRLLEVDHSTASRWLRGLCIDEVLRCVEQGSRKNRQASQYRYLQEL